MNELLMELVVATSLRFRNAQGCSGTELGIVSEKIVLGKTDSVLIILIN